MEGALNAVMAVLRFLRSIVPSNLKYSNPSRFRAISIRSMKLVNCEKTTALKYGSVLTIPSVPSVE